MFYYESLFISYPGNSKTCHNGNTLYFFKSKPKPIHDDFVPAY